MSRRHLVQTGLVGAMVSGMAAWGALPAIADEAAEQPAEGTAAAVDLSILSDDELVALEARIAQEKLTRGVNAAYVTAGQYTVGVDFDAGSYVVTCLSQEKNARTQVTLYEDADKAASYKYLSLERVQYGETLKVDVKDGYVMAIEDSDCALAPFSKLTFGASSADASAK